LYSKVELDQTEIDTEGVLRVSVEITNSGQVAGEEVAQLYVGYEGSQVERPVKELKGFTKAKLEPGETKRAEFTLPAQRLAYYDEGREGWVVEAITYKVYVGASSATDALLVGQFRVKD
jgi:beta-glucosidase